VNCPHARGAKGRTAPPRLTIAEVLRATLPAFSLVHRLPAHSWKVLNALLSCRTARLGGHVYRCRDCGAEHFVPHSCRNRHCPLCQRALAADWLASQEAQILPIPYFHVVFTLPHGLNPLIQQNQKLLYNLLFRAASATLLSFGAERFRGQIGVTAVLHTWSQNLGDHYHLHCLVTGGGWDKEHATWRSSGKRYLFPVQNLAKVFRGRYLAGLQQLFEQERLRFAGQIASVSAEAWQNLLQECRARDWVVYSKRPFAGPAQVLRYLSRYTHRIAIGANRLQDLDLCASTVTFGYKDYTAGGHLKSLKLGFVEFTRRFCLHILPARFVKIRHYGILGHRDRARRLDSIRSVLVSPPAKATVENAEAGVVPRPAGAAPASVPDGPRHPLACPQCGSLRMDLLRIERAGAMGCDSS
jgi:predicted RNA-binding Zn-ribbon protein involved in translation (DUF1610 family)